MSFLSCTSGVSCFEPGSRFGRLSPGRFCSGLRGWLGFVFRFQSGGGSRKPLNWNQVSRISLPKQAEQKHGPLSRTI